MFYTAHIYKDGESWSVEFPDLGDTFSFGSTLDEARRNAEEALDCTLLSLLDEKRPFPEPKTAPDEVKGLYAVAASPTVECAYAVIKARGRTPAAVVARRMGITPQSYGRIENPRSNLSVRTMEKVARALGKRLKIELV